MRVPANPFLLTGYHSPAYFCDREQETAWLIDQFENERNAVIHSWRRIGKTALLKHFFYKLNGSGKADCVYVDLLGTASIMDAKRRISEALFHQWLEPGKSVGTRVMQLLGSLGASVGMDPQSGTPQLSFSMTTPESTPVAFEAIGKFLTENKQPVVICLDEFQQVAGYGANAEAMFRAWSQQFPMVRFIYSGSHREMMVSMFSEKARPFYRSSQILSLEPLPGSVYAGFIASRFTAHKKTLDNAIVDRIFRWTRMQTYYVQLICNKLYARVGELDNRALDEVLSEVIQQEVPLFSSYQALLTNFQWKLLMALAKEEDVGNPMSKTFLQRHDLGAASSVNAALRALEKNEFVIFQNERYSLHDTLLMRWMQQL